MPKVRRQRPASGRRTSRARRATRPTAAVSALSLGLKVRLGARTEYRIYPSIGIARVGDCTDSFIIGPEAPGIVPTGPFRGGPPERALKPQAARFRIYKVEIDANENETVVEEVVTSRNTKIVWSATLANRKAAALQIWKGEGTLARGTNPLPRNDGLDRSKLVIAASGSVTGSATTVLSGSIEFAKPRTTGMVVNGIVLATLRTDDAGRLLVVGGPGESKSPFGDTIPLESFADNNGWYDSVSDGPVSATLQIRGQDFPVIPAWVLVTVPRYSPATYGVVTWYDQAVNMARTDADGTFNPPRTTSFTRDIYPILKRADDLSGVHGTAHANGAIPPLSDAAQIATYKTAAKRNELLSRLAPIGAEAPAAEQFPPRLMPFLRSGANPEPGGPIWTFLTLTKYQMGHFENWVHGNFEDDWPGAAPVPPPFEQIPVARQAWALCEAALEACVGGSFFPGIEGTYDIARIGTYHPEAYLRREFRINPAHPAGILTEKMALPWQADFADCARGWWPSQRPVNVTMRNGGREQWARGVVGIAGDDHLNMVKNWSKLGIVIRDQNTGKFVEDERTL